jgi:hypothetical protein
VLALHAQHDRGILHVVRGEATAAVGAGVDAELGQGVNDFAGSTSVGLEEADGADFEVDAALDESPPQ